MQTEMEGKCDMGGTPGHGKGYDGETVMGSAMLSYSQMRLVLLFEKVGM